MPENQRSNPSALTLSRMRFETRVQRVESKVIIGIYSPQAGLVKVGLKSVDRQVKSPACCFLRDLKCGFQVIWGRFLMLINPRRKLFTEGVLVRVFLALMLAAKACV